MHASAIGHNGERREVDEAGDELLKGLVDRGGEVGA
jgi:hypothetical protein